MSIEVPLKLKHRSVPHATDALLILDADGHRLAEFCAQLSGSWPTVHRVSQGFIVLSKNAAIGRQAWIYPLRCIGGRIYLPIDADLMPTLTLPEIEEITSRRGLVFLPHRPALSFDRQEFVQPSDILDFPAMQRRDWQSLPEAPAIAEGLRKLVLDIPRSPDAIIESGSPMNSLTPTEGDDSEESEIKKKPKELRPPSAPFWTRVKEGTRAKIGKGLTALGGYLKSPGLAQRGADMVRKAIEKVPRLTEDILDKQEASLRELLRRFREGDKESALKQAPIAVGNADGPSGPVSNSWQLGNNNPLYSLKNLLRQTPGSVWLGGGDVWGLLAAEYRKMAEEAVQKGDHRRAAYIHGHLLSDLRTAANVLAAGGLHRDAAILYRDKLKDYVAAAAAFESAGDLEEALRLYEKTHQFEKAGDLLRRIGEEDSARTWYRKEADRLATYQQYLEAGDFLRKKLLGDESAEDYYRLGLQKRGPEESSLCGQRLFDGYLVAKKWGAVRTLLTEVEEILAPPAPVKPASDFFAHVRRFAGDEWANDLGEEVRDHCRLALAKHLSHSERMFSDRLPAELFGNSAWSPAIHSDAAFAYRAQRKAAATVDSNSRSLQLLKAPISAAVMARGTFDLVAGSVDGQVVCWRAETGQVEVVAREPHRIDALATDEQGKLVVTLSRSDVLCTIRSYSRQSLDRFQFIAQRNFKEASLLPAIIQTHQESVQRPLRTLVNIHGELQILIGSFLIPVESLQSADATDCHLAWETRAGLFIWNANEIHFTAAGSRTARLPFLPRIPTGSSLQHEPIAWVCPSEREIEIASLTLEGNLYRSTVSFEGEGKPIVKTLTIGENFRAVDFLRSGSLAAVTDKNRLHWLRAESKSFKPFANVQNLPSNSPATALFNRPTSREIIVLFQDGSFCRVSYPRF